MRLLIARKGRIKMKKDVENITKKLLGVLIRKEILLKLDYLFLMKLNLIQMFNLIFACFIYCENLF
jgi:hypothetical protein